MPSIQTSNLQLSLAFRSSFSINPTIVSTIWPSLNIRIVGIARISYLLATSLLLSMLTLQILTASPSSSASSFRMGAIALHGPHHGAQKSTTIGVEMLDRVESKLELSSSVIFSDLCYLGFLVILDKGECLVGLRL